MKLPASKTIRILFVLLVFVSFFTLVKKLTKKRENPQVSISPELQALTNGNSVGENKENSLSFSPPSTQEGPFQMFRFSKSLFPSKQVHQISVQLALDLMKKKDYITSKKILEDVLKYEPQNVDVLNNLAFMHGEEGDWVKAEEYLRRAIQVPGNCPECNNNLGNALAKQSKYEEAKTFFQKAIQQEPKYLDAYLNLALLLEKTNEWAQALEWYNKSDTLISDPEMKKMVKLRSTWMLEITQGKRAIASH